MEINIEITATTVSVIAAVVYFVSMCCSIHNAKTSNKNLELQMKKYEESKPNFKINTLHSEAKNFISQNRVVLRFFVLFTNLSDKGTSLKNIKLRIIGETNNLILQPVRRENLISNGENLGANHSNKGWIEFEINGNDYKNLKIIRYELEITDIYDNTESDTTINLMEEVIENEE